MKNIDENSSKYAMGFVLAFAVVMATPAFAEKVMHTETVEVTKTQPATQTTTTTSTTNANGDVSTTRVTETHNPVTTKTVTYAISDPDRALMRKYLTTTYPVVPGSSVSKTTYVVGKPLPTGVTLLPLPVELQSQLTPVPAGYSYGLVDRDIVLLESDRDVADVISYYETNK